MPPLLVSRVLPQEQGPMRTALNQALLRGRQKHRRIIDFNHSPCKYSHLSQRKPGQNHLRVQPMHSAFSLSRDRSLLKLDVPGVHVLSAKVGEGEEKVHNLTTGHGRSQKLRNALLTNAGCRCKFLTGRAKTGWQTAMGSRETPQGSIVSPFLLNVAMIKLLQLLNSLPGLQHSLYASDIPLRMSGGRDGDIQTFKKHSNKLLTSSMIT